MPEPLTARTFFMYLAGSYFLSAMMNIGFGLMVDAGWKFIIGGTLFLGMILFAITLTDQRKKQNEKT